jgi:hypothetical protein
MAAAYRPLYFASAVLPDGRVIVEGGEYNCNPNCVGVWQTQGAIYNPLTNTWTPVSPPAGWTSIGDASAIVLADGTFLLSDCCSGKLAKFNPSTLTFTAFGSPNAPNYNNEQNWTLLPDKTILTVDVFPSGTKNSERFNPATGTWSSAGSTIVSLADNDRSGASFEIGAGVLRPNGTVFCIGANPNSGTACCAGSAHTAIFNTATNTWSAGPNIPNSDAGNDAPAACLPSGNVLMLVAPPASSTNVFGSPSRFYEFDGSTIFQVTSPPSTSYPSYVGGMLVLPTGQVLVTTISSDIEVYTPLGVANAAWAPTITSVPSTLTRGATYTIAGTQFNGLTEGAYYGDDLQSATNYPLVRITNTATGHVFYARTHDHSSMGVATGSTPVSTLFDVSTGIELGASSLVVVTNGIASSAVSVTITSGGSNDAFASAQVISGISGSVAGNNVGATKETGEPNHGGNAGGHSVWYQWQAPASGTVTMDTVGSNFDTLLGVYTGSSVGALTTIAGNDDDTGVLTSKVSFSAVNGTLYRIAVDGWGGTTGNITLNWNLSGLRIDTVAPPAGRTSGGQQILLTGAFSGLSTVTMGGVGASWFYTNGPGDTSKITVTTPAHSVGAVQIDLTPTTGSVYSKANAFAYLPTVFTDDTITLQVTTAKAQHIIELRQAVDAMRAVSGLGTAPWADPSLVSGNMIRAVHIQDLRTYLNDAASRLGYSTSGYTDPSLTSGFLISRVHIEELRQRIRTIAG